LDQAPTEHKGPLEEAREKLQSGKYTEAIRLLQDAVSMAAEAEDILAYVISLDLLATAYDHDGNLDEAKSAVEEAIDCLDPTDSVVLPQLQNKLGYIERELGNLERSESLHTMALEAFRTTDDTENQIDALINLAVVTKDLGRLTEARVLFEQALRSTAIESFPLLHAHALIGLGLTFELLQNSDAAERCYHEAVPRYRAASNHRNEALALHNIGKLHQARGDFKGALSYYQQSKAINLEWNNVAGIVSDLSAVLSLYQLIGGDETLGAIQSAQEQLLAFQIELGDRRGQVETLIDQALLYWYMGRTDTAEQRLSDVITLTGELLDLRGLYTAYRNRADIRVQISKREAALEDYAAAAETSERIRVLLLAEHDALSYIDDFFLEAYDRLIELQWSDNPGQAFFWNERARAREFLRRLRYSSTRGTRTPPSVVAEEERLLSQIRQLRRELDLGPAPVIETIQLYTTAEMDVQALWQKVEQVDKEYIALRRGDPVSFEDVRRMVTQVITREESDVDA
jgi:tetratricopeptide (TPR) repeat protein